MSIVNYSNKRKTRREALPTSLICHGQPSPAHDRGNSCQPRCSTTTTYATTIATRPPTGASPSSNHPTETPPHAQNGHIPHVFKHPRGNIQISTCCILSFCNCFSSDLCLYD